MSAYRRIAFMPIRLKNEDINYKEIIYFHAY